VTEGRIDRQRDVTKGVPIDGRFEPTLRAVKIPRCPNCAAPNPRALSHCESCGLPQPDIREERQVEALMPDPRMFPWHARLLFAIGAWLKRLGRAIQGD
jgi:hypothetical protein